MSGGLLSGLEEAERCPYSGWKTVNNIDQGASSPEDDDVCLLDDEDNNSGGGNETSSSIDKRCLSDGHRSPTEFVAVGSSYKIPKKSVSLDIKSKEDNPWLNSSEVNSSLVKYCSVARYGNYKWKTSNYSISKGKSCNEIGYRIRRQGMPTTVHQRLSNTYSSDSCLSVGRGSSGQSIRNASQPICAKQTAYNLNSCTPKSRWKHADAPGTLSSLRPSKHQEEPVFSCQETGSHISGNNSDAEGPNRTETRGKPKFNAWSKLKQEQAHSLSVLDLIMKGKPVGSCPKYDSDEVTSKGDNATVVSDSNCETESDKNEDVPGSSKGLVSGSDYDDCFSEICPKCLKKLSEKSRCQFCDNCKFPAQAATPRKHLSSERFYSAGNNKLNTKRTYSNRRLSGNHTPVLLFGRQDDDCQTHCTIRKKKKKGSPKRGKSRSSGESDSDYKPQQKRHCKRLQQKTVTAEPVVITLSDEEEEALEEETQQEDEKCPSPVSNSSDPSASTVLEVPCSPDVQSNQDFTEAESSPVRKKRKGEKLSKEKHKKNEKRKVEKVHGYERDNLEIEIMLGQRAYIGTLACTSTEPLKITCRDDTIRLNMEYGTSNLPITIAGKDLEYFKMSSCSSPDVIVLGVTSGFALKLKAKIHTKGKFFDPGSAVAAEKDIVLEASECVQPETMADIMEWVKDKLSKEFFELSLEEKERILSNKESGSTAERHQQSSKQELGSAVAPQTRFYNTRGQSNKHSATVESKRLITYPPRPQQDGITVTTEDVACLAPGEFLNDVIIDFYLKYVFYEKLKAEDRERTYILSSFFYKRLTQRTYNNAESQLSNAERMYANVRTWTKNVEIFDKDFVVVPINESSHWYLAVICFAGHDQSTSINEVISDEEETNTNADTETKDQDDDDGDDDDNDFENVPLACIKSKAAKEILSKKASKETIKSRPCILVFDSLGNSRIRCMFNLRNYLTCEWSERRKDKEPREFTKGTIRGYLPKVPQQDNFCDCGVFVLQYMESFFEDAITDFTQPIRKPNWFSLDKIARKRDEIRKLIYQLKESTELDDP